MRRALTWSAAAALACALTGGALAATATGAAGVAAPASPVLTEVTTAGLGADVVGTAEVCNGPALVCPQRMLFGLATPQVLKLDARLTSVESALGRTADLVESYQDFTEPIYTARLRAALRSGRTPVVTWEPFYARRPKAATYPLARIAAGRYDAYLRRAAAQAKAVGAPFVIRLGHEMNGFWYPWGQERALHPQSVADPANTPAAYVAAFRHVVDVFRAEGATDVVWMWSPNVTDANPSVTLASLYPGDAYVDVIGLSGYLEKPGDTFDKRYRVTLTELRRIGRHKPVIIAETGAVKAPTRAGILPAFLAAMASEPRIVGVVYFSQPDKAIDYRIESDPASLAAMRTALDGSRYSRGATGATARTPVLTGNPRVGTALTADWAWRGSPDRTVGTWFSCPDKDTPAAGCTRIGWGSRLPLTRALRGRYVRATLGVLSPGGSDQAESLAVGPVLTVPGAVEPAGIDLLSSSQRLRLPAAPPDVTRWVVRLDGGDPVYLPAATAEHHFQNLAAGSSHTVSLAATDGDSVGPATTRTFAVVTRPVAPAFTTRVGGFTVTLPPPATGQTGWLAVVDGVEEELPLAATSLTRTGVSRGSHSVGLRAIAGDGRTSPVVVYPYVP
jgi:hypothetical protein